ncbi:glycosyltransferase family 2 protein [Nocardioides daphniae]|uniref:Cellulose synthase n=1 Tax=Nocardioides daphniae TaxID=402297 RepID=A0A4P7UEF0_9ACTN|nr:glycosyltransferase family 2 protein [Nocardioides daphniae]QCC77728.1 glycosyltransferase [Nocardioides daphniae]GGD29027.1 cellulose synthase [Nocardioides daphniae]
MLRQLVVRVLVVLTLLTGTSYVVWRWGWSVNWDNWWIAVPLVMAETYALVDAYLFGLTMWKIKVRGEAPPPPEGATVDVFITTYNEPVEMVMATATAAQRITFPHRTWILDDGNRADLAAAAAELEIGYLTRSDDWADRPRHAKAGNLNNALFATDGEFMLILDADQIPDPSILDRTLGWFTDPEVALVQTPQWFTNVTDSDPLGSQAPLFYGPIQQGKDGWNSAFFCGSNAVLRREALMQLGIVGYVREVEAAVEDALRTSRRILARAARAARRTEPEVAADLESLRTSATQASRDLRAGASVGEVTYAFQKAVDEVSRGAVQRDLAGIRADLDSIAQLPVALDDEVGVLVVDDVALDQLAERDFSPLGALESVRSLIRAVDVDRGDEAQPMMPLATVSVTEDMATCMRLHALGWKSVYHHEVLAHGLAPEDLRTMLQQRLRWAQGTLQVLLKENPLVQRGLSLAQRLMYFSTMWSYLSGFAALVFMAAPVFYLCFGVLPVHAYGMEFLARFLPYIVLNQLLFLVVGYGVKTWRGHQYSLALFPLWIRACTTAFANVFLHRPLGFVVTPKTRQAGGSFPWRLIWPQVTATVVLVGACVVGVVRLWTGAATSTIGTGVNVVWVAYDLLVMSIIYRAALHRPADTEELES